MRVSLFIVFFITTPIYCQQYISLWPKDKMPNTKNLPIKYKEERQRILQVDDPGIYAFFTSNEENQHSAVLICPGGGYHHLTYNLGGIQLAKWFNTIGINAFVLIYRLPNSPDLIDREKGPIQDAQRAMKIIRANAKIWKIDTNKIGIMGTSAGGHLASYLITHKEDFSYINDSLDNINCSPDYSILVSPVISLKDFSHKGTRINLLGEDPSNEQIQNYSNEDHVTKKTPPTFLVHAQDDSSVSPFNSILFYQAMLEHGVEGSLHIFPQGQHKIGLRNNPGSTELWTNICEEWLKEIKIIQ